MLRGWRIAVVFVGIFVLALVLKSGIVAFAVYVLLGVYLLSRYLAQRWIMDVMVTRDCPNDPLEVGDSLESVLTIQNTGRLPIAWILLEDMLPEFAVRRQRLQVKGRRIALLFLAPTQEKTLKLKVTFLSRGYYPIGPCIAETGDVFGLHRRHRVLTDPVYILVLPRIVPMADFDFASRRPVGEVRLTNRLFEDPTRSVGVRPYQVGDPLHRVHWRATARTGQLHCRIYEPTSLAGATIVIDFHKAGYPKRSEPHRSDLAVTIACSLAYALTLVNQPVGLASNGRDAAERIRSEAFEKHNNLAVYATRSATRDKYDLREQNDRLKPIEVPTRRGIDQFEILRETLARLELSDGLTFSQFLLECAARWPKDATLIVLVPMVSTDTALSLGMLRRLGFSVSVILVGLHDAASEEVLQSQGRLLAEGIRDVRLINNEADLKQLGDRNAGPVLSDYTLAADLI